MYARSIVDDKLSEFKKRYGWKPEEHSVEEIDLFNKKLESYYVTDKHGDKVFSDEKLTPGIAHWMKNERALVALDCSYFLTRYFWLTENEIQRFAFRSGQRAFYNVIQRLEEKGVSQELQVLKARKQGLCLHPDTRILTSDLHWIPIRDVAVGTEVFAVDEQHSGGLGADRKMRVGVVEAKNEVHEPAICIRFDNGQEITATPNHRFLHKHHRGPLTWKRVKDMRIGDDIRYVTEPWGESTFDDGWMAGFIDGEAHIRRKTRAGVEFTLHQTEGAALAYAREYLRREGYDFREEVDKRTLPGGAAGWRIKSKKIMHRITLGRIEQILKIAGKCRPRRILPDWWIGKSLPGKRIGSGWRKIVSMSVLPDQRMIDLQTSTKTFIAEGLVSHNSTITEAMMTHSALYVPGARCSIGSADDQKTAVMMDMMYGALEHIPWYLRPTQTKDKRSGRALLQFARIGTSIVVQHGAMRGGIGQGTTPNKIHLSECCDFTDPQAQIEEGLFKAVPSMPYVFMVLESTGNGNTGWWADQWRVNKEKYWQGRSRLLPLFLPWFMTPELYPTDHWLAKFPFPEGWRRDECPEAVAMADKARLFVMSSPMLLEILGRDWILPDRQLWYWQYHYEEAKVRRMEKSWVRQMATDDYDALIGDNDSSFDRDSIIEIETNRQKTCQVYGILGEGIAEKHDPDPIEVDYTEPRISVDWKTVNDINLNWMLMPLRGDVEDTNFDPLKKLLVWFPPERGAKYSIGIDTGFGVGGDRSAIEVNRCGEGIVPDEQVAEFAADDITNVELYAWAMCIAAWYGKYMEDGETPRFVIEQRRKYGDSCYHALKLHGFRKHHHFRHYDKKTMRPIQSPNQPEGWWTNEWSRPMLLETYKYASANGWCKINSRFLLAEMEKSEQFVGSSGKIREDHVTGEHDDRKFAMAMAYFTWHDSDLMAERSKQRYNNAENEDVQIDYGQAVISVPNPGSAEFFAQFS